MTDRMSGVDRAAANDAGVTPLRAPPHDMDAEAAVLSACLLDGSRVAVLAGWLDPTHFYANAHRRMWEGMLALHAAGQAVDAVTLAVRLKDTGRIAEVGGLEYITSILDSAPAVANVEHYAAVVHERYRVRAVVVTCQQVAAAGYQPIDDTQAWIDRAAASLDRIGRKQPGGRAETNLETLTRIVREIHERMELRTAGRHSKLGMPTGIMAVDRMTGGYHAGGLHVVAGLRGRGKTTYGRQSARFVAGTGTGVLVFCTEQSREEWLRGLLALEARVDLKGLREGTLDAAAWARVYAAAESLKDLPITVDDRPDISPALIRAAVRAHAAARRPSDPPLGLVVVDHLHRLAPDQDMRGLKRYDQLFQSAVRLKNAARAAMVPHLVLAQQRVLGERGSRVDPKPADQCIKECPAVEDEADDVVMLWRQPPPKYAGPHVPDTIVGIVTKARFGTTGEVALTARLDQARFDEAPPDITPQVRVGVQEPPPGRFDDDDPEPLIPQG